ncbi:MAG: hypothetical protein WBW81_00310 [Methylocella sp.]
MARTAFILGIWVLAASLGILGYQGLTFYFYQQWPPVSLGFGWRLIFGDVQLIPYRSLLDALNWLGKAPLVLAGVILSYALFLLSDGLRGRSGRRR